MTKSVSSPLARFARFERVRVVDDASQLPQFADQLGTVIWRDGPQRGSQWAYVVYLPTLCRCWTFPESSLQSMGEFDHESEHLGRRAEITFDIVMGDDMAFVAGCYRLPDKFWEVFNFHKEDLPKVVHKFGKWKSGITGLEIAIPEEQRLNRQFVLRAMSEILGIQEWTEVLGPDSIILR